LGSKGRLHNTAYKSVLVAIQKEEENNQESCSFQLEVEMNIQHLTGQGKECMIENSTV
jgi:hypothetical protein